MAQLALNRAEVVFNDEGLMMLDSQRRWCWRTRCRDRGANRIPGDFRILGDELVTDLCARIFNTWDVAPMGRLRQIEEPRNRLRT